MWQVLVAIIEISAARCLQGDWLSEEQSPAAGRAEDRGQETGYRGKTTYIYCLLFAVHCLM